MASRGTWMMFAGRFMGSVADKKVSIPKLSLVAAS